MKLSLSGMAANKPDELVIQSLVRAKFCECTAPKIGLAYRSSDLFLMGLFSMLDAIIDRPLDEVLEDLPLSDDVKSALLGDQSRFNSILAAIMAYEKGDWASLSSLSVAIGLNESELPDLYVDAVQWPRSVLFNCGKNGSD